MAGNIQNVSFMSPNAAALFPDIAAQEQALARRQAFVDALRQQGQEDINPNGGAISWTQGLAKMLSAYAAGRGQRKVDQEQLKLAQALRGQTAPLFGLNGQDAQAPGPAPASPPANQASPAPAQQPPGYTNPTARALVGQTDQRGAYGSGGMEDDGNLPPPSVPASQSDTPPGATPLSVPGGATPAAPPSQGPLQMPGLSPQESQARYMMDPQGFMQQLQASSSPTNEMKNIAAQYGWGTPEFKAALAQMNAKNNYIAPINARQGSVILDATTNKPIFQTAQVPVGSVANYGPDGKVQSITAVPGGTAAIQATKAAEATGSAAGDLVDVYDPTTHQMVKVPKLAVLSGAAGGQKPFAAGAPLGAQKAFDVSGGNSANAFQAISDGAADVPNRIYALNQMSTLVNDPRSTFGPGSTQWNHLTGLLGTLTGGSAPSANNAQEFNKWAAQYSARSAQELGLSGSDARVQIAIHATPNGEMNTGALKMIIPQMVGLEHAKQGYANAAVAWQQTHGPDTVQDFRTEWNKVYNPGIYTHMVQGPQAFAGWVKSLSPQQAGQVRQQYLALKQLGALPQ
jgi:hypothetical protein